MRREGAEPVDRLSPRLPRWSPDDVLLVVGVSDETLDHDLSSKATLYARTGYGCYWVVTRDGVYEHTEPSDAGYGRRVLYHPGDQILVRHAGSSLAVSDLLRSG